eukprot:s1800_g8.t1
MVTAGGKIATAEKLGMGSAALGIFGAGDAERSTKKEAANGAAASGAASGALDDDDEEDSGAEEVIDGRTSHRIKGEKKKIEVSDFFDDLMEGFAEIWRLTVAGGHSFASCVRRVAYPLKVWSPSGWVQRDPLWVEGQFYTA